MKHKWLKRISIFAGILFLLVLIANFGVNIWLKNKLPDFLKKNTDYIITYKNLDVDLGTGNIFASGISVNTKNPDNTAIVRLQGTIDTLRISRFGIYDAVFNKRISSSDLLLGHPDLNIILAQPKEKAGGKKKELPEFENIRINNGNIRIFKTDKRKFLSVNRLNISVENIQMTENSIENALPVVFDKYHIKGENFFFRPENLYAISAKNINTQNGRMSIKDFRLIPLLSGKQFQKYYPNRKNMFSLKSDEMNFTDIILKKGKISLADLTFQNPDFVMYSNISKPEKKEKKENNLELNLNDIFLNNVKIEIRKTDETPVFSAENVNVKINRFVLDKETSKGKIPFMYADFLVSGKNISVLSGEQEFKIASLSLNPKSGDLQKISAFSEQKSGMNFTGERMSFKMNEFGFKENKLNLDIENILINQLNGTIKSAANSPKKKSDFSGIQFPVKIKMIGLKNSNLVYDKGNQPLAFNDLNANLNAVEISPKSDNSGLAFNLGNYSATTRNFKYKTQFYNLAVGLLKLNKSGIQINNFSMIPTVSRSQFIRMIPVEKDLYTLKAAQISMTGKWDLFSKNKFLEADNVTIRSANANIFRSKIPKDDPKIKPLYSELLRKIKFPMFVHQLDVKNSYLEYEEDTKKSDGPGKLTFSDFNLNAKNLNSGKMKGKPTEVPITINCKFFKVSPMNVSWKFNTANLSDVFTISGNISSLPAPRINPFVEPYLKIRTTGTIENLKFNFHGNKNGLDGSFNMKHKDLKVAILKNGGEKDKVLSAVANIFVKGNSGNFPESVVVDDVPRDPTKSFFNLFWKGIEEGLKKTLIGKNVEKTEEKVKNTVEDVKTATQDVKSAVKSAKTSVKEATGNVKEKVQNITKPPEKKEKKKRGIFGKRDKTE